MALVTALLFLLTPAPSAARVIAWNAPEGTRGWCTAVIGQADTEECYGSPEAACRRQFQTAQDSWPIQTFTYQGYTDNQNWWSKSCHWKHTAGPGPTSYFFNCDTFYVRMAPGVCVPQNELFLAKDMSCRANNGGTPNVQTPFPIDILTGNKQLAANDFAAAAGAFNLDRTLNTLGMSASGAAVVSRPTSVGNWALGVDLQLHLSSDWTGSGVLGVMTPEGGFYRFSRSGGAIVPYTSSTYPQPSTDYSVEFVGTLPTSNADVTSVRSNWIVRGPDNTTWYLQTFYSLNTGSWDIARPVQIVQHNGYQRTLTYDDYGALTSISDNAGSRVTFDWIVINRLPKAISSAHLSDGSRLDYVYESFDAGFSTYPSRLIRVERRDASNVLLDKTSYQYSDTRFPVSVTAILDRDDVQRWSVTYDARGRALQSSGPSSADTYTVSYGADGTSFTRTVTNPLGKQAIYNFTRGATNYDVKLVSVAGQASTNCPSSTAGTTYGSDKFIATTTDEEGRVTAYTRNSRGLPTQIVEAQGTAQARTTDFTWDTTRLLPTAIATPGLTTTYAYNATSGVPTPPSASTYPMALTLINAGAETGDATGWTAIAPKTALPQSSTPGGYSSPRYFTVAASAATAWWGQTVLLPSLVLADVDAGGLQATLSARQQGYDNDADSAALVIEMLDGSGAWLSGRYPATIDEPDLWYPDNVSLEIPPGTRSIRISVRGVRETGTQLSQYFDEFALSLAPSGHSYGLLYSMAAAATSGWTTVAGTLTTTASAGVDPFGADTSFLFTSSTTGEAYREITISDAGQQAQIDAGTAKAVLHARYARYATQVDKGRLYLKFYDGSGAQLGATVYSDAAEIAAQPETGQDKSFSGAVPANTRKIRIGFTGSLVGSGSNIDTYWSRMALLLEW